MSIKIVNPPVVPQKASPALNGTFMMWGLLPKYKQFLDAKSKDGVLTYLPELQNPVLADTLARLVRELEQAAVIGNLWDGNNTTWDKLIHPITVVDHGGSVVLSKEGAELIWLRRVASALWVDLHAPWSKYWRLNQWPGWQIKSMLGWNVPTWAVTDVWGDVVSQFSDKENAQNMYYDPNTGYGMLIMWDPNPLDFIREARRVFEAFSPITPVTACAALVSWMRKNDWFHGYWTWYRDNVDQTNPPGPPGGLAVYTDGNTKMECSAKQAIRFKWGGCPINGTYLQRTLVAFGIPTVRTVGFPLPWRAAVNPTPIAPFVPTTVTPVAYSTKLDQVHTAVNCYGAGLAMFHSDFAIDYPSKFADGIFAFDPIYVAFYATQAFRASIQYAKSGASPAEKAAALSDYREAVRWATLTSGLPSDEIALLYGRADKALPADKFDGALPNEILNVLYIVMSRVRSLGAFSAGAIASPADLGFATRFGVPALGSPISPFKYRLSRYVTRGFAQACVGLYPPVNAQDTSSAKDISRSWAWRMMKAALQYGTSGSAPDYVEMVNLVGDFHKLQKSAPGKNAFAKAFPFDQYTSYAFAIKGPKVPGDVFFIVDYSFDPQAQVLVGDPSPIGLYYVIADMSRAIPSVMAIAYFARDALVWYYTVKDSQYDIGQNLDYDLVTTTWT